MSTTATSRPASTCAMPAPMRPAPSTPTRSTGRASRASAAAFASTRFFMKKIEMRLLAVSPTTRSAKASASTRSACGSGSLSPRSTTSMARSGAG